MRPFAGAFVEPARAFREGQESVRAGRRTTVLLLSLHEDPGFETPDNEPIMSKDTKTMSETWSSWGRMWADGRIVLSLEFMGNETPRAPEKASSRHLHRCKEQAILGSVRRAPNI